MSEEVVESGAIAPRLDTTLVKSFDVLEALCRAQAPLTISLLSEALGIGRSNVHRLLTTLSELGYVRREPNRRYSATLKIWEIGALVADRSRLRRSARQIMVRLAQESGEGVVLAVLSGTDILYLDKIEPPYGGRTSSRAGLRVPAIFPATGKALIAHQPNPEQLIRQICTSVPQATALRPEALIEECAAIRDQGYATSASGWTSQATAIAVPVPNDRASPHAALGIASVENRLDAKAITQLAPILLQAAAELAGITGQDPLFAT